ncbi:hypothetical protein BsWGS_22712 [Bradybaena similaris]
MAVLVGCTISLAFVLVLQALTFSAAVKLRNSAIVAHLRNTSDPDVIPLPDNNDSPLNLQLALSLEKIIDVDRERNEIEVLVGEIVTYTNLALAWDLNKEGFNATGVTLPNWYLWLPDIAVYNAVSSPEVIRGDEVNVHYDGFVTFFPVVRVRVWCDLQDVDSISGANCSLKLGSWTQNSATVSLYDQGIFFDMQLYLATPNYEVLATSATKHSKFYPCCPESYEHIEFSFIIRKQDQPVEAPEEENRSEK